MLPGVLVLGKAVVLRRVLYPEMQPADTLSRGGHPQLGAGGPPLQLARGLSAYHLPEAGHVTGLAMPHEPGQVGKVVVRVPHLGRARRYQGGVPTQVLEGHYVP